MKNKLNYLFAVCGILLLTQCESVTPRNKIPIIWTQLDRFSEKLPSSIHVFYGENNSIPLKVWYTSIELNDTNITVDVVSANGSNQLASLSEISSMNKAVVAINAGYFREEADSVQHIGLLKMDHQIVSSAILSILYKNKRYFTARGAFGIMKNGQVDIAWVSEKNNILYKWKSPIKNSKNKPHEPFDVTNTSNWDVEDAVQAGPVLVSNGKIYITKDEEAFYYSNISKRHPRAAAGITRDHRLILLVIEGRQINSRGAYPEELAKIMKNLGCVEAINLDGGGSASMIVDGQMLIAPSEGNGARKIMSAITVSVR